uniref:DNA polymerase n=1 Tax=Bionectria ochroleuca TaxID=29856 RepID=A0A0B7JWS1_BIOOC
MDLFRVRLNCIDHYQATPTRYDPQLRNDVRPFNISKQPKVPVIRVFGSTETGQKVCAHIHGAFPYLYIEYDGHLAQDSVGAYIYRLHLAIDQALAVSYRRNQFDNNARYVARITLVKGVPFYGFHVGYKFYLKIYMFNPVVMTRLTDLLQQGAIMKRQFQPYEAHLQYLLQFMTDYNLYGCEFIDASNTKFRAPVPDPKLVFSMAGLWRDEVKRRKRQMAPSSEPGTSPLPYETLVSMSAESRASQPEPWLQETELREAIHELVGQELDSQCKPLEFDSFVTKPPFEDSVKTALQSVEDLHPEVLLPALGLAPEPKTAAQQEQQLDEQDEQDEFNFPYDSDQDIFQALFEREQAKDKDLSAQNTAAMGALNTPRRDSKEKDVPTRMREYAGREFRLRGNTLPYLPDFDPTGGVSSTSRGQKSPYPPNSATKEPSTLLSWDFAKLPPSYEEVESWWSQKQEKKQEQPLKNSFESTPTHFLSQIEGPTPDNKHGFKYSPRARSDKVKLEGSYMSTMSLEIHVNTRGKLVPNPEEDEVQCIFWSFKSDDPANSSQDYLQAGQSGVVVLSEDGVLARRMQKLDLGEVHGETSELDVFVRMVEIVRFHDPDVLTGFEVHASSWGFLIERARLMYDFNLCDQFSRMKCDSHGKFGKEGDRWGFNTTSTIRVTGRHMINIWRAMRGELSLLQYTMENIAWHLLHRRVPHYPWEVLTRWYRSHNIAQVIRVLRYYQARTRTDLEILEANELVSRTSEQARVLGVDFFSVFSRGSQFKVESIMFRIAKPENFMLVSPSRKQVGGQNALECLPLVMEPHSAFYSSPVVVLDFQSLYPSVMIAYNYCYSTFLGRVTDWRGMNKMGFTEYRREQGLLGLLEDDINISPNGMMYVKPEIRKSLLAKMLREILETRVMVKSSMKKDKEDKALQRLLNNRQLALKLLANVTYGYTSASFSGRMPCSEIADSIVQTARETLERAVAHIQSIEKWAAHVVYGDTDSIFVYLPGRSKDEAFDIGNEIADAITNMNPRPIKLKFEKVYLPCVLLAKKRYVGYKYESRDQVKPDFDAKGIETVRRDGTPAEQKMEEKALRMLFESADLSRIKSYFREQCRKIIRGHVSIQDFCFAKEYYITKNIIPPLERIFNLVGASVRQWYDEMPKVKHHNSHMFAAQRVGGGRKMTLEAYFQSMHCVVCSRRFKNYRNST